MAWAEDRTGFPTVYIHEKDFRGMIQKYKQAGQAWRFRGQFSTYCPSREKKFSSIDRLRVEGPEDFEKIMAEIRAAGADPIGSYGDIFSRAFYAPPVRHTVIAGLHGWTFGGWQQAFKIGRHRAPVYLYDLNSAYRGASERGLPDLSTAFYTRRWDTPNAVFVVDGAPMLPYARGTDVRVITSEERDYFKLDVRPEQVLWGMGFRASVPVAPTWKKLEKQYPHCIKRVARAFWGRWCAPSAPEQVSWGGSPSGEERSRTLRPICYNPIWAAFITSRVKLRLCDHITSALHVYVDSILSVDPLPTGDMVGDFRLVEVFPKGVWIRGTGQWGTGLNPRKHAGVSGPHLAAWSALWADKGVSV